MCWWRRKQTSPRGAGAAALGALAIFHSLPALQLRHNCTQIRHRPRQGRRCCIPSQHRRDAMTPPRPANRKRAVLPLRLLLCARAAAAGSYLLLLFTKFLVKRCFDAVKSLKFTSCTYPLKTVYYKQKKIRNGNRETPVFILFF